MKLADYIENMERRVTLARAVGYSPDYLWQVATGRRQASHKLANAIDAETAGMVSRCETRPDIFGELPSAQPALAVRGAADHTHAPTADKGAQAA